MKLMLAYGRRPLCSYRSLLPLNRVANSDTVPPSPFQNRRTLSRYLPFHSVQSTGKVPDLITALAYVPRFCDELDARKNWILMHNVEERAEFVDCVQFPS